MNSGTIIIIVLSLILVSLLLFCVLYRIFSKAASQKVIDDKAAAKALALIKASNTKTSRLASKTFRSTLNIYGTDIPTHKDHDKYKYLLKIFHDFAIKYDIKYFIAYGTLLGQIRNQDFIPYDYDIDVVIEKDSISKLFKLLDSKKTTIPIILNKDLKKTPLTNKNSPKLILNSSHPCEREGHRYNCNGDMVSSSSDGCSFQSLIGRLVYIDLTGKNFYMDLFGYFNFKNHYGDSIKTVNFNFPIVPCKLAGIDTFRPSDNISKQILKNDYGKNYLKPDHIYDVKHKKWIKDI